MNRLANRPTFGLTNIVIAEQYRQLVDFPPCVRRDLFSWLSSVGNEAIAATPACAAQLDR